MMSTPAAQARPRGRLGRDRGRRTAPARSQPGPPAAAPAPVVAEKAYTGRSAGTR